MVDFLDVIKSPTGPIIEDYGSPTTCWRKRAMAAEARAAEYDKLATFAREFIKVDCWGYQPEIDAGDVQDLAAKLGIIVEAKATAEDAERTADVCEGSPIYKFAPWMKETSNV
jgi:hypothetical protein